jgi:hypothetical protein
MEKYFYISPELYEQLLSARLLDILDETGLDEQLLSVSPEVCKQPGGPKGFSATAFCKAQGLIPRADGRIYKSEEKLSNCRSELELVVEQIAEKYGLHPGGLKKWFEEQTPPELVRKRIGEKAGEPFPGGWVRVSEETGEIIGPCDRKSSKDNSSYPKCMSYEKWKSLTKQERIDAVKRKQAEGIPARGKGNKPKLVKTELSNAVNEINPNTVALANEPKEWDGLALYVEYSPGEKRIDSTGVTTFLDFYGYFEDTNNLDSEELDFYYYSGSPVSNRVFIVEKQSETGTLDELKVMLGYPSQLDALKAYLAHNPIESFKSIYEISSSALHSFIKAAKEFKLSNSLLLDKVIETNSFGMDTYPIKLVAYKSQNLSNTPLPMLKIPVAKLGSWVHPVYKRVEFTQRDFDEMIRNFKNNVLGFPPYCRYGHSKYPNSVDAEPSVGEVKALIQEGNVLYAIVEPNNEETVEEIRTKKYRFSSPELTRNFIDKNTGKNVGTVLTAIALTNAPFLPNLPDNQVLSNNCPDSKDFFVLNLSTCEYISGIEASKCASPESINLSSGGLYMKSEMNHTLNEEALSEASQERSAMTSPMKTSLKSIIREATKPSMKESMKSQPEMKEMEMEIEEVMKEEEEKREEASKKEKMPNKNTKEKMSQSADLSEAVSTEYLLSQIQALSKQMTELSNIYQARLKEADERLNQALSINAQLEARLRETEARTEYLTSQAYAAELNSRKAEYIRKGVPPFIVNKIFDIIQSNPSQQIRLSNGEQVTLQSQLEEILSHFPPEYRVSFQQFSSTAAPAEKAENPFRKAGIIK